MSPFLQKLLILLESENADTTVLTAIDEIFDSIDQASSALSETDRAETRLLGALGLFKETRQLSKKTLLKLADLPEMSVVQHQIRRVAALLELSGNLSDGFKAFGFSHAVVASVDRSESITRNAIPLIYTRNALPILAQKPGLGASDYWAYLQEQVSAAGLSDSDGIRIRITKGRTLEASLLSYLGNFDGTMREDATRAIFYLRVALALQVGSPLVEASLIISNVSAGEPSTGCSLAAIVGSLWALGKDTGVAFRAAGIPEIEYFQIASSLEEGDFDTRLLQIAHDIQKAIEDRRIADYRSKAVFTFLEYHQSANRLDSHLSDYEDNCAVDGLNLFSCHQLRDDPESRIDYVEALEKLLRTRGGKPSEVSVSELSRYQGLLDTANLIAKCERIEREGDLETAYIFLGKTRTSLQVSGFNVSNPNVEHESSDPYFAILRQYCFSRLAEALRRLQAGLSLNREKSGLDYHSVEATPISFPELAALLMNIPEDDQCKEGMPLKFADFGDAIDEWGSDEPFQNFCNEMLKDAIDQHATDVWIYTKAESSKVFVDFEIAGKRKTHAYCHRGRLGGICARYKILADLNIAEKRFPQAGRLDKGTLSSLKEAMWIEFSPNGNYENVHIAIGEHALNLEEIYNTPQKSESFDDNSEKPVLYPDEMFDQDLLKQFLREHDELSAKLNFIATKPSRGKD